jgi:hypothetical protein
MTQEFLSHMLGVRREGVTHAAGALQELGLISYVRGHIKTSDQAGLEKHVCECYAVVRVEHSRLGLVAPGLGSEKLNAGKAQGSALRQTS